MVVKTDFLMADGCCGYSIGAELDLIWLISAQRSNAKLYLHRRDSYNVRENKYTNWANSFDYFDAQVW